MPAVDDSALRLRAYLLALTPQARRRLREGLEQGRLRGDGVEAQATLAELRRLAVDSDSDAPAASLFFRPLDTFLVDDDPARRQIGRVARASLPALWAWICHDLAPQDAAAFTRAATEALEAGDEAQVTRATIEFQDRAVAALRAVFADESTGRTLIRAIGTPHAEHEAATLRWALRGRDALAALAARLPARIDDLPPRHIPACIALIEDAARPRDVFVCALLTVFSRLTKPWQIVRFAAHMAGSRTAARLAATPYGIGLDILMADTERQVAALSAALADGDGARAVALIRAIDAAIQGLHSEIDIPVGSTLARRLDALDAQAAAVARSGLAA
jgi:hypothetical protein